MRILVDADSCGKVRKIARIGKELKVPIILYHDDSHEIESCDDYESKVIPHGKDAVDFAILKDCKKNDVVITQDTGLASLVLAMNAFCIHPKGFCFTNQNIMSLLTTRYLNTQYKKSKRYNNKGMTSCYKGKKFDFEESLCDTVREARQQECRKKIQYA